MRQKDVNRLLYMNKLREREREREEERERGNKTKKEQHKDVNSRKHFKIREKHCLSSCYGHQNQKVTAS